MPLVLVVAETARKSLAVQVLVGASHAAAIYTVSTLLARHETQGAALAYLARVGDTQALEAQMLPIDQARALTTRRDGPGVSERDAREIQR